MIAWLLAASDPAIRWQAMRDLADADAAEILEERARVPHAGLAAEILERQDADGSWRRPNTPVWASTLFTLLLLRATGVDRSASTVASAVRRLASGFRWDAEFDAEPFFEGEVEPCINGGTLAVGGYFGRPSERLARRLIGEQLEDGGWNCEAPKSTRSSFNTTICVLDGLLEYERAAGDLPGIASARRRGEDYLLDRNLFRRRSTGEIANPAFLELAFPPRYHYDILRALDYFRDAGREPDERMAEALDLVENKRQRDGRWLLDRAYDEPLAVPFDESAGGPSRWNTLRALRVLRWYERPGRRKT